MLWFPICPNRTRNVLLGLLVSLTALGQVGRGPTQTPTARPPAAPSFLQYLERATPANRVIGLLNYFDTCQTVIRDSTQAVRLLAQIDALAERVRDKQLRRYPRLVGDTHAKHRNPSHADNATLFLAVGEHAEDAGDAQIAAVCQHFVGQYYFLNEEYGKAFEHLLAANKTFREIGYQRIPEISRYLYELAFNYYYFQEYDKAIGLLKEAARYPVFNANLAIQTYNTLGMAYTVWHFDANNADDHKRAMNAYQQARRVAVAYGDSLWVGIVAENIANEYGFRKQWAATLREYRLAYNRIRVYGGEHKRPDGVVLRISNAFFRLGRLDSCQYYLALSEKLRRQNRQFHFGDGLDDEYVLMDYYDLARLYYRAVGNLPLAYRHLDSLTVLKERINKRYNSERLSLVNQKLLVQQHQSEVAAIEAQQREQQTRFWLVGVVLALVAGLFFRLYQLARLKRRQEAAINAEREKSLRLEKQLIEEKLQQATADLSGFMDNLREKNELIDTISAQLSAVGNTGQAAKPLLDTQQQLLQSSLLTHDDWDAFRQRFDRVHPHFFEQVRGQFAGISPAEERLLALSKLRVDTRQMSRMLGISPDSIHKTRYRLRKKLTLNGQASLLELLSEAPGAA